MLPVQSIVLTEKLIRAQTQQQPARVSVNTTEDWLATKTAIKAFLRPNRSHSCKDQTLD